jgi:hypothetical protein
MRTWGSQNQALIIPNSQSQSIKACHCRKGKTVTSLKNHSKVCFLVILKQGENLHVANKNTPHSCRRENIPLGTARRIFTE